MKIQERDLQIIDFIKRVVVADTSTIHKIFFSNCSIRSCQKRLQKLEEGKYIKSFRETILDQKIFYINRKPSSYKHKIVFSKLIGEMTSQGIEIIKYKTPLKLHNIIADGFIIYKTDTVKMAFVEVERCKNFNIKKYEDLYYSRAWRSNFEQFPGIIVASDKKVNTNDKFDFTICKLDLSDLNLG